MEIHTKQLDCMTSTLSQNFPFESLIREDSTVYLEDMKTLIKHYFVNEDTFEGYKILELLKNKIKKGLILDQQDKIIDEKNKDYVEFIGSDMAFIVRDDYLSFEDYFFFTDLDKQKWKLHKKTSSDVVKIYMQENNDWIRMFSSVVIDAPLLHVLAVVLEIEEIQNLQPNLVSLKQLQTISKLKFIQWAEQKVPPPWTHREMYYRTSLIMSEAKKGVLFNCKQINKEVFYDTRRPQLKEKNVASEIQRLFMYVEYINENKCIFYRAMSINPRVEFIPPPLLQNLVPKGEQIMLIKYKQHCEEMSTNLQSIYHQRIKDNRPAYEILEDFHLKLDPTFKKVNIETDKEEEQQNNSQNNENELNEQLEIKENSQNVEILENLESQQQN